MTFLNVIRERLLSLVFVVFGVTVITFTISHLIPTDVARLVAGDRASNEVVEAIRHELGLDQPVAVQYVRYLGSLVRGDLGVSNRTGQLVSEDLANFFPATLELVVTALLFAVFLAVPLGVISAIYKNKWPDHFVRTFAVTGISIPSFWLGLMMIYLFFGALGWFPAGGRIDSAFVDLPRTTGLLLVDTLLAGRGDAFLDVLWHLTLPATTLALVVLGGMARLIRASMLEVLAEDYVRTATAAGLPYFKVVIFHVLPNALIPFVTTLGLYLAGLLAGTVVIEIIFSWPGMGSYTLQAISALDFPAIMGFTVVVSFIYVLANLLVDLSYLVLDPRMRKSQ